MILIRPILPSLFLLLVFTNGVLAQWTADSSVNTLVAGGSPDQVDVKPAADGSGGVIFAWRELRPGSGWDIVAQRMDTLGSQAWPPGGVAVCTTAADASELRIAPDGRGGAVLAWTENRGGSGWDVYAQRIDSNGVLLWADGGVAVCTADTTQDQPQIDADGEGGAIVAWRDFRNATDRNIFAQRIDSTGAAAWTANGVPVCATGEDQNDPQITGDGTGGAVIAWEDLRSSTNFDIYAQRIGAGGSPAWATDGIPVSFAVHDQINPRVAGDGAARTVIAWEDARSGVSWDIYAQRVNGSGIMMWNPGGEAVCASPLNQWAIDLADDGGGGAFIAWQDLRNGSHTDIYAQHLDNFGGIEWAPNGAAVCQAANEQSLPRISPDGSGGAYIAWHDLRDGSQTDIYVQRINASGSAAWTAGGKVIAGAAWNQLDPVVVTDGGIGAIAAWKDGRPVFANDIYAQNINPDGSFGPLPYVLATAGPFGSVSPPGITPVPWGGSLEVTVVPAPGYHIDSVFVDGGYVGAPASYIVEDVYANVTVHAVFAINVYTITASAGPNGSISQPGTINVVHGQTQAYGITPDPGYEIGLLLVDGAEVPETTYYIFSGITASHTIGAWFGDDSTTQLSVKPRWNIVSVPSVPADYSRQALFPAATTPAFYFDGAYQQGDTLLNGPGYWLKFPAADVVTLMGAPLTVDTFDVADGWNMVGSISDEVPVGQIESVPPGIVTSQFFSYSGGYVTASAIRPGKGYWVKASGAGQLILSSSPSATPSNRIRIVPTDEPPPPPPEDGPLTETPPAPPFRGGFGLEQNYPNPFNPVTMISYRLTEGADVRLEIFDVTGRRVAVLAEGRRQAGTHHVAWNAGDCPAGIYFCRLRAGSLTDVRKIALLR